MDGLNRARSYVERMKRFLTRKRQLWVVLCLTAIGITLSVAVYILAYLEREEPTEVGLELASQDFFDALARRDFAYTYRREWFSFRRTGFVSYSDYLQHMLAESRLSSADVYEVDLMPRVDAKIGTVRAKAVYGATGEPEDLWSGWLYDMRRRRWVNVTHDLAYGRAPWTDRILVEGMRLPHPDTWPVVGSLAGREDGVIEIPSTDMPARHLRVDYSLPGAGSQSADWIHIYRENIAGVASSVGRDGEGVEYVDEAGEVRIEIKSPGRYFSVLVRAHEHAPLAPHEMADWITE